MPAPTSRSIWWTLALAAALALVTIAGCAPPRFVLVRDARATAPPPIEIRQLHLQWSNVFLVRQGGAAVLVDSGSPGDWDDLVRALRAEHLAPRDIRLAVLTHGHGDHAGLAARLRRAGVPVALGRGDLFMAAQGHNDPLRPTGFTAALIRPIVDFGYPRFAPDLLVDARVDLAPYGLAGAWIEPLPGHTPGALVVWVGARDVLAGDVMLGGAFGGGTDAGEHFYQRDVRANHCNVDRLLREGAERFYVGHGGPIARASVLAWRRGWQAELARCPASVASPVQQPTPVAR